MRILISVTCLAVLAAVGYYFTTEYLRYSERQRIAKSVYCERIVKNDFKPYLWKFEDMPAGAQSLYLASGACVLDYPYLAQYYEDADALTATQNRDRRKMLEDDPKLTQTAREKAAEWREVFANSDAEKKIKEQLSAN